MSGEASTTPVVDPRITNGEIIFPVYDNYLSWMFDNYAFMEVFRFSLCLFFFIILPSSAFGAYRLYWWSLEENIYIPPNRIE